MMTTDFGNLSISQRCSTDRSHNKIENNDRPTKFDDLTTQDPTNSGKYSFINTNSNIKSTSFNNSTTDNDSFRIIVPESKHSFKPCFNPDDNLMSTSFNEDISSESLEIDSSNKFEELDMSTSRESTIEVPPPPPEMTSSLANYLNSLPKKNLSLSTSSSGQRNLGKIISKFPVAHSIKRGLPTQSSVSAILQNQCTNNFSVTRPCKFNYDLDCRQYPSGCNNLNVSQCKPVDSKFMKSSIFQGSRGSNTIIESLIPSNVPPLPVINHGAAMKNPYECQGSMDSMTSFNEKPKVKFSNTVTHILVPEIVSLFI